MISERLKVHVISLKFQHKYHATFHWFANIFGSWTERCTVMFLSFRTDRPEQIRLLLEEQSDQGLHCLHLLDALLYDKATLFKF